MIQQEHNKKKFKKWNSGPSAKEDNWIVVEWYVMDIWWWWNYIVNIEWMDLVVNAYAWGKLKKNNIKLMKWDRVQVKLNEYDPKKWIITFRLK